jgi:hypothetical protein
MQVDTAEHSVQLATLHRSFTVCDSLPRADDLS